MIEGDELAARAERERAAYEEGQVWETSTRWHARFQHVFDAANTLRLESVFAEIIANETRGKRVLELGSGDGVTGAKMLELGAEYVLGIDVAENFVNKAQPHAVPGRLEFRVGDVSAPIEGQYDVIVGRAILHHIHYRQIVPRLFEQTLRPGGALIFMEPLGGNMLLRAFARLVPGAHTGDERSFRKDDLDWFRERFGEVTFLPFNYSTLPLGMASTFVFPTADNFVLRAADRFDVWVARRFPSLAERFRQVILIVRKP